MNKNVSTAIIRNCYADYGLQSEVMINVMLPRSRLNKRRHIMEQINPHAQPYRG